MKNKKNKKQLRRGIPSATDRLDKELIEAIKLMYSLGNSKEKIASAYHISIKMVEYSLKQRGGDINE